MPIQLGCVGTLQNYSSHTGWGPVCLFRDTVFIDMQGWGLCFPFIPIGAPQNWYHTFLESRGLHLTALRVGEYLQAPGH